MKECQVTILGDQNQSSSPYQVYSEGEKDLIGVGLEQSEFDPNDPSNNIELNIYDANGNLVYNDPNFTQYTVTSDSIIKKAINSLNLDPGGILLGLGFTAGIFKVVLKFNKNQLNSSSSNPLFFTQEISPNRQEIRVNSTTLDNLELITLATSFSSSLSNDSNNFDDFYINFGEGQQYIANNILVQSSSFLIHLYEPLPNNINLNSTFYVVTQQADPLNLQIELPVVNQLDGLNVSSPPLLKGPNFNISIKDEVNNSTNFKSLSDLINIPLTSSYNQLQNILNKKGVEININYENFSNFIHFSSAKDRLDNFYYKISLIESSSNLLSEKYSDINNPIISQSKINIENNITNIIKNFDGFENYLYFESTSLAWPKSNSTYPYTLHSTGSTEVLNWLGSDVTGNVYFGGRILSASEYDVNNVDALVKTIPEYLREDDENYLYGLFTSMIGQHFDNLYFYTKDITNKFDNDNRLNFGISKDLVSYAIKDLGVKLYQNNFSSDDLYSAYLGISQDGTNLPPTGSEKITEYITSSNEILPLKDVNTSTYKRIYHNLPYLLKKKGTVEGLKALITCFGIPDTILKVSEFGGKDKINTNDWDYYYNKFSKAVKISKEDSTYIKVPWLPLHNALIKDQEFRVPDTVQFRFKTDGPPSPSHFSQSLWMVGTDPINLDNDYDFNIGLLLYYKGQPITGSIPHDGEISSTNYSQGELQLIIKGEGTDQYALSPKISLPFFDKNWWSVQIVRNRSLTLSNTNIPTLYKLLVKNKPYKGNDGSQIGYKGDVTLQVNNGSVNENWANFKASSAINTVNSPDGFLPSAIQNGAPYGARFGFNGNKKNVNGSEILPKATYFSGSIQEIRFYSTQISEEVFDDYVMNPESIEGLTLTGSNSSYNTLAFRGAAGNELLIKDNNDLPLESPKNNYLLYNSIHPSVTGSSIAQITSSFVIANPNQSPENDHSLQSVYYIRDDQEVGGDIINNAEHFNEVYYMDQPNAGIRNRVSDKIKIISSSFIGETLSPFIKVEQNYISSESYTSDINYLEVAFSPQNEINDDIISNLGYFNMGEYIGDPRITSSLSTTYKDLNLLRKDYFKKYFTNYNFKDYIRLIKYFDNSLFKMIKDFIPARTGVASGVVIKQHLLERNRYPDPTVSSLREEYTGSINTAFIQGDPGGSVNGFSGRLETSKKGSYLQYLSASNSFSQSYSESFQGPSGSTIIVNNSQKEFFNGEFSGSILNIIVETANPYNGNIYKGYDYKIHLYSAAGNRHIKESTFLNPSTTASSGQLYLYYETSSVSIENDEDLNQFTFG